MARKFLDYDGLLYFWSKIKTSLDPTQVGDIIQTVKNSLGSKYVLTNGAEVTQATYPDLYSILPTTYSGVSKTWGQVATTGAMGIINGKAYVVSAFNSDYNAYEYDPAFWTSPRSNYLAYGGAQQMYYLKSLNGLTAGFGTSGQIYYNPNFPASLASTGWAYITLISNGGAVLCGEYFNGYYVFLVASTVGATTSTKLFYCNTLTGTYSVHTLGIACYSMCYNATANSLILRTMTGFYIISDVTIAPTHTVNASLPSTSGTRFLYYANGTYMLTGYDSLYYYYGDSLTGTFTAINNPALPKTSTYPTLLRMTYINNQWVGLHYQQTTVSLFTAREVYLTVLGAPLTTMASDRTPSFSPTTSQFLAGYSGATPIEIPVAYGTMAMYFPSVSSGGYGGYASALSSRPYRKVPTKSDTELYTFIRALP